MDVRPITRRAHLRYTACMSRGQHDKPLVCVVDDDDAIRRALIRLVHSLGFEVQAFSSPRELLLYDRAKRPACLLLDVHLPVMSGFELYDRLIEAGDRPPVIFITGRPRHDTMSRAARVEAVACFEKPFDGDSLINAIREAVSRAAPRSR